MRIAGGRLGGRRFEAPAGHRTHPMSEQIRNALFNALGDITGKTVLDAYGGSGAVAFEAISRGAYGAWATEKNPKSFKTLRASRDSLGLQDQVHVSRANCVSWVENQGKNFDIIVADPPYSELSVAQLEVLARYLAKDGILVVSHDAATSVQLKDLKSVHAKTYGNAQLSFFTNS